MDFLKVHFKCAHVEVKSIAFMVSATDLIAFYLDHRLFQALLQLLSVCISSTTATLGVSQRSNLDSLLFNICIKDPEAWLLALRSHVLVYTHDLKIFEKVLLPLIINIYSRMCEQVYSCYF